MEQYALLLIGCVAFLRRGPTDGLKAGGELLLEALHLFRQALTYGFESFHVTVVDPFDWLPHFGLCLARPNYMPPEIGGDIRSREVCPAAHLLANPSCHVMRHRIGAKGFRIPHRVDNRLDIRPGCVVRLQKSAAVFSPCARSALDRQQMHVNGPGYR